MRGTAERLVCIAMAALLAAACSQEAAPDARDVSSAPKDTARSVVVPAAAPSPDEAIASAFLRAGSHVASVRDAALVEIDRLGTSARDAARRALSSPVAGVRRGAARTLERVADASCSPELVAALGRADDEEAASILTALGRCGTPDAAAALVATMECPDAHRAMRAAAVARDFGGALDLARLRADAASQKPGSARLAALVALGGHAEPCDHELFLAASRDPVPPIRAAAARGCFSSPAVTTDDVRRLVVLDPDESVRAAAAAAAAFAPTAAIVAPLSEAMATFKDDDTVPAAIAALAAHHDAASFDALLEFVRDDTQPNDLRGVAIRALAQVDRARAVDVLKGELAIFDMEVRVYSDEILVAANKR